MDYKDKIRKLLALAKSPEPEEAKLALLMYGTRPPSRKQPGRSPGRERME